VCGPTMPPSQEKAPEGQNLWAEILQDVSNRNTASRSGRSARNVKPKTILVLGDEGVGKSAMIAGLRSKKQGAVDHQGTGMEYAYLEAREEDSEDVIERIGIYTLDGDQDHAVLLQSVISKESLADTVVLVVVDLSRPWLIMESLKKWSRVLGDHLETLDADEILETLKAEQINTFRSYTEDQDEAKKDGEETIMLDLEDGVLASNHGIPMIVVGTKDDFSEQLAQERDFRQEHFDFIQMHIRKFCLAHGAGLIYSGKVQKTADAFYRYALHLTCGLPFTQTACISETEGLFIPRGWDNPTKVSVLSESFSTIKSEDPWESTIRDISATVQSTGTREVIAETEQAFLEKQRTLLSRAEPADAKGGSSGARPNPVRPTATSREAPRSPRSTSTARSSTAASSRARSTAGSSARDPLARPARDPTKTRSTASSRAARTTAATPGAPGADPNAKNADVLANFFNSLLGNNAGGPPGAGAQRGSRADAARELSKMQGKPE